MKKWFEMFFFFWDLAYLGLFFIQNVCKRVWFLEILRTYGRFAKFVMFVLEFVFERSSKLHLFRGEIIASLLV